MKKIIYLLFALTFALVACNDDNEGDRLQRTDIIIMEPEGGWIAEIGKPFNLTVKSVSDEGVTYRWFLDDMLISTSKNLTYIFKRTGQQRLQLIASQDGVSYNYNIIITVQGKSGPDGGNYSPYITKVIDYMPAPGQFTNRYPLYVFGDTPMDMNNKVLDAIGNNNLGVVTLGGFGGYVIVGFDHTIQNKSGKRDFRILGNVYDINDNASSKDISRGGAEPGIIMVAYDYNKNGKPDENEWFEIQGSAHINATNEPWYDIAKESGNDMHTYKDYEITYYVPEAEPETEDQWNTYIRWTDNHKGSGFIVKNGFHKQSYYPQWIIKDELKFKGTRLPQNAVDRNGDDSFFAGYNFQFGYADNAKNEEKASTIDIDWAVDKNGKNAKLPGVDFIKIYTGVNQQYGMIGECSTEISGIEDLHILDEDIDSKMK